MSYLTKAFTVVCSSVHFRVMQRLSFYRFPLSTSLSGNATPLLLPFFSLQFIFGQSRVFPFTIFPSSLQFRAMQLLSFYRFYLSTSFSGNAELFLLPFSLLHFNFGQCSASPFTVSLSPLHFRAMQSLSFYHFSIFASFSGLCRVSCLAKMHLL